VSALPDRAEEFLRNHPALGAARAASKVWERVKEDAAVTLPTGRWYLVGGDTLGGEAALFLDRLARGANAEGSDEPSRQLFLELPDDLQAVVRRDLLLERTE